MRSSSRIQPIPFVRKAKTVSDLLCHSNVAELLSDLTKIRADIDSIFVMVNMRDGSGHWRSANMSIEEVIAGLECAKLEAIDKRLCGEEGT